MPLKHRPERGGADAARAEAAETTRPAGRGAALRALIVDDDPGARITSAEILAAQGFEVATAETGEAGLARFTAEPSDVVLLDLKMPGLDGISVLGKLKTMAPRVPVIIVTGFGDVPSAVEAMRLGAYDYLTKPVRGDELVLTVERAVERQALLAEVESLRQELKEGGLLSHLMGPSAEIQRVIQQVRRVASTAFTVVIQGETGTGKELVARVVHQQSPRRNRPFLALDCGAVPETLIESELFGYERGAFTGADRRRAGYFQMAAQGTLFFDEIANLPLGTQAKLLRALQERAVQPLGSTRAIPVDVRLIAASNVPLEQETQAGRFRQDLYYRLSEFTITLPPLRERREDIPHLARRFLEEAAVELQRPARGFSEEALQFLLAQAWPGNVRELRNVVRRAVLVGLEVVRSEHLRATPDEVQRASTRPDGALKPERSLRQIVETAVSEVERDVIRQALQATHGNKSEAARLLRTDYKTLHVKIKRYGISAKEFLP